MFSEAGQPSLAFVLRGGGKGGGGGGSAPAYTPPAPIVLTDPVNGKTFVQQSQGITGGQTGMVPMPGGGYAFIPGNQGSQGPSAWEQLNAEIADRQAGEKAASETKQAAADKTAADKETTFQTSRQGAYDDAMKSIMQQFTSQGVDPTQYMESYITPTLQRQFKSIQDLDPNPGAAFSPDLGTKIINDIVLGKRTTAGTAVGKTFTPDYSTNLLPDTLTGQYANTILDEQFSPLMAGLTNAQKRGTLTPAGYNAALDTLNQKRSLGLSQINTLGGNILSSDRKALDDYISGVKTTAGSLGLADTFDPSGYATQAAGKAQKFTTDFGGALRSAVGDTKFADLQDLINAGGTVQGAGNPTAANPLAGGAGPIPTPEDETQKRGLGSTGAF